MNQPGPLIGSGRAADIYDIGHGRVLRRDRFGARAEVEARLLTHLLANGFPVPKVFDADGADLVMARIDGPTMLEALPTRPWRLTRYARLLADLVNRLATVPLPDFDLPEIPIAPEVIIHGDFHPGNVMLGPNGPVVIDWATVCIGPRGGDAAMAWVVMTSGEIDARGPVAWFAELARGRFARIFVDHVGRAAARALLAEAAAHRISDPGVRPAEIPLIHRLLEREGLAPANSGG